MSKSRHSAGGDFKSRWICVISSVIALLILPGCAQLRPGPLPTSEEAERIIEVEAVDQVVHYRCQCFWDEEEFSELSENELETRFKDRYKVDARDFESSFDEANHSTVTECYIYGTISKSQSRCTADFLWLLNPLELDFIDDHFKEFESGLSWQGSVKNIPTSIEVKCPPQGSVYEAWQYPVGHCHGHVWWPSRLS